MEEACRIIEDIVNLEMKKRPREPLEWAGSKMDGKIWRANVAGSNCYEGAQESVGLVSVLMRPSGVEADSEVMSSILML